MTKKKKIFYVVLIIVALIIAVVILLVANKISKPKSSSLINPDLVGPIIIN